MNGAPSEDVVVYEQVLPERCIGRMRAQVAELSGLLDGRTFWYDLRSEPTTYFEQIIQLLHQSLLGGRDLSGAEYWMRMQPADRVFFLHVDRDEAVRERYVCPALSSVFYLSEVGGPTAILPITPSTTAWPQTSATVWPSRGRYVLFRGDFLHGVLPGPPCRWRRVAFFVNWWQVPLTRPLLSSPDLRRISSPNTGWEPPPVQPRRSRTMPEPIDTELFLPAANWEDFRVNRIVSASGPAVTMAAVDPPKAADPNVARSHPRPRATRGQRRRSQ